MLHKLVADLVRHASLNYATYDLVDDFFLNGLLLLFVSPFCSDTVSLAWSCSLVSLALDDLYDSGVEGSISLTRRDTDDMLRVLVVRWLPTFRLAVTTLA